MQKAGAWYSYNGERIGQGRDNVRQYLKEHTEISATLEEAIRKLYLPQKGDVEATKATEEA